MEAIEIVLLAAGGIIFILSFLIPGKKGAVSGQTKELAKEEVSELVRQELESVRSHIDDVVEEAVTYAMEKTERSLERLSNEKIMAVNEYSDTVLTEIHKNHEEAMFLYDMLNSKHVNLKNTVSEINRTMKEAEKTVTDFRSLSREVSAAEEGRVPEESEKQPEIQIQRAVKQTPVEEHVKPAPSEDADPGQGTDRKEWNNNRRIMELYSQGKSKVAIARELGLGVGEVKLVVDLFRSQARIRQG